jgi:sec-independent protein translocase protein TatC
MMGEDMSFFDHLEELRRRLIIAIVAIGAGFVAGWVFLAEWSRRSIEADILGGMKLTALTPLAAALARMKISLVIGLVAASPVVAYEFLAFVIPALKPKEKRLIYKLVIPAVALFLVGLSFGYLVMVPLTMNFLMGMFKEDLIVNMWGVDQTISFIFLMLVAFGAIFEYPLVAGMVSSLGLVGPDFFRKNRPLAVIGILVVAAVITPDPTMISQIVVAVPMYILYEVGILLSSLVYPGDRDSGH